jgi:hypothetical protein
MIPDVSYRSANGFVSQKRLASIEADVAPWSESILEKIEDFPDAGKLETMSPPLLEAVTATEVTFFSEMES